MVGLIQSNISHERSFILEVEAPSAKEVIDDGNSFTG